ncbi:MAG: metallophosphoesterase [Acidobacteriaceae bacterium]|nr:metallophosphoesterase [Acidobacteriaceae bacterium]MBV9308535.1 metallophosphoesterase [Acidobacteriaceae bacterium]
MLSQRQKAFLLIVAALLGTYALAQNHAMDLPTSNLLSEPGPTFRIPDNQLHSPAAFIAYGDMRFTDPNNKTATDPRVRKWLVDKIAQETPDAVLLNGDVPLAGDVVNDYQVYRTETQTWRDAHLHVYPALGNHEFHGPDPQRCLENWWNAFPEMRNRRWYSAQIGSRLYSIALDSDASLLPESDQARWLTRQLQELPLSVDFVVLSLHHPPVADIQKHIEVDHNPRPNEIALRDLLSKMAPQMHARILVSAGHIHNYERHEINEVIYLVSGGGGAKPYFVERTPDDLYQSSLFPNYHYIKFVLQPDRLHATMYRIADPEAESLQVQVKDEFDVSVKGHTSASTLPASR